jgi:hypothetical protein
LRLARSLQEGGYAFQTLGEFVNRPSGKSVILRHDVDSRPEHSLAFSKLQKELGIRGSYFFRCKKGHFDSSIIGSITSMGHEIGYHYEDLSRLISGRKLNKAAESSEDEMKTASLAMEEFRTNLSRLRKYAEVKTICMHGSPMSRWDSRLLWKYFDYRDLGIIAEPYLDLDFSKLLYLTDTGRRWDGWKFSIRDKLIGPADQGQYDFAHWKRPPLLNSAMRMSEEAEKFQGGYKFHSTGEIVLAAEQGTIPENILMTFHPQRWTANPVKWTVELLVQSIKNPVKYMLNSLKNK